MATFLAKIKVREGKEAEFEEIAKMMFRETHAHEPTCRRYEYWRGVESGTYYCMESFDDYLGFMKHQTSDHHEAPDFDSVLESVDLEWIDPVQGACELSSTDSQDMPVDASDLMKEYAKNMPVVMQNWWLSIRG
jgi:quinol monooxygenase YgiN